MRESNAKVTRPIRALFLGPVLFAALTATQIMACGGSSTTTAAAGGAGSNGGETSSCAAGDTRSCVGPGACDGGQVCGAKGWQACDCGAQSTGGAPGDAGSGGTGTGGSGGHSSGGEPSAGGMSGATSTDAGAAGCNGAECNSCPTGKLNCDADPDCETPSSIINCGGCGVVCESVPHADNVCENGSCVCLPGYSDCTSAPGCETPSGADPKNCGGCGHVCASGECAGGGCSTRVFVTSKEFDGKFGGVAGGDAICQGLANAANLKGTFVAWLGEGLKSGADRVPHSPAPYRRLDGVVAANSWAELSAKFQLMNSISVDETGATVVETGATGEIYAWTGTTSKGGAGSTCLDWTDNSSVHQANAGEVTQPHDWLDFTSPVCQHKARLLCFEVLVGQ